MKCWARIFCNGRDCRAFIIGGISSTEVKLGRIQNYKNWSPDMVPDPGTTALGLIRPGEVLDGTVVRAEMAYPVYEHDYRDWLRILRTYLDRFENLQTIGRNGLHRYNNMDHSMLTGLYAARNILGGGPRLDVWSVNTEQRYHEESDADAVNDRLTPLPLRR